MGAPGNGGRGDPPAAGLRRPSGPGRPAGSGRRRPADRRAVLDDLAPPGGPRRWRPVALVAGARAGRGGRGDRRAARRAASGGGGRGRAARSGPARRPGRVRRADRHPGVPPGLRRRCDAAGPPAERIRRGAQPRPAHRCRRGARRRAADREPIRAVPGQPGRLGDPAAGHGRSDRRGRRRDGPAAPVRRRAGRRPVDGGARPARGGARGWGVAGPHRLGRAGHGRAAGDARRRPGPAEPGRPDAPRPRCARGVAASGVRARTGADLRRRRRRADATGR